MHGSDVPLLGVNLGHVGFLAELEREDISEIVHRVVARDFTVEVRLTLDITVRAGDRVIHECWALNEATVEKAARERMLEVVIEVDGRPLSTVGADGVVMATPTGSTAYAFSAGGPVVWPEVEALLLVPISAHALFARPLVVGPSSRLAVEVLARHRGHGRPVVRRPAPVRAAPGVADRGGRVRPAGAAGPDDQRAVHRPAGRQVPAPGGRLARSAPLRPPRLSACWRRCGSAGSA